MPTQQEVAVHLGISQQAVSEQMKKLKIVVECATMDEIRLAYLKRLREQAAGHENTLAIERAKTEVVDRQIKELVLEEKRKSLVRIADLKPMLSTMMLAFRNELRSVPQKVVLEIETLHGIRVDADLIGKYIDDALRKLSQYDPGGGGTIETGSAESGATGEDINNGVGS